MVTVYSLRVLLDSSTHHIQKTNSSVFCISPLDNRVENLEDEIERLKRESQEVIEIGPIMNG